MQSQKTLHGERLLAWVALGTVAVATAGLTTFAIEQSGNAHTIDGLVAGGIAAVGAAAGAYLVATAALAVVGGWLRTEFAAAIGRGMPSVWRSLVSTALGVALTVGGGAAATATSPGWGPGPAPTPGTPEVAQAEPAEAPDAPTRTAPEPAIGWSTATPSPVGRADEQPAAQGIAPAPAASTTPTVAEPTIYTVRRGDSLWAIASARLDADATNRDIDREWRRIWRANRDVVGDNPGLIFAGQRLVVGEEVAA